MYYAAPCFACVLTIQGTAFLIRPRGVLRHYNPLTVENEPLMVDLGPFLVDVIKEYFINRINIYSSNGLRNSAFKAKNKDLLFSMRYNHSK